MDVQQHRDSFGEAYARLNERQREAVDTIEGPVMVVAGPGTGKTQILTLRVANILRQTDTAPESVLALTFTEAAAREMRERLRSFVGQAAYRASISTFHGFCDSLIRAYPDAYPNIVGGQPASDIARTLRVEQILTEGNAPLLRPAGDPSYYVQKILGAIGELKREYVTPDIFAERITADESALGAVAQFHTTGAHRGKVRSEYAKREKQIEKNRQLLAVYRRYEELARDAGQYDFDDMILETLGALDANEEMLRDLQERYQYLLADEHQDVNRSQNGILARIAGYHARPNLFVVGDEKQAVFRFQGASLENFLYFTDAFPGAVTISLTDNYRSGQQILDASHGVIATDTGPAAALRVPLAAALLEHADIERRDFRHQDVEDAWVVGEVVREIAAGTPAAEIAVILRTNREIAALTGALTAAGVPARASAERDALAHPAVHHALLLLTAAAHPDREDVLAEMVCAAYWDIPVGTLVKLFSARRHDVPLSAVLADPQRRAGCGASASERARRVVELLTAARERALAEAPHRILAYLVSESGLLDSVLAHHPFDGAQVLRRLYDEVEIMVGEGRETLAAVAEGFLLKRRYNLPLTAPYATTAADAVEVLTVHKSKGREFAVVCVPHLTDSGWGGAARAPAFTLPLTAHLDTGAFDAADDDRRLLYVAMTRAKRRLLLSFSAMNAEGRALTPSRLLADLPTEAVRAIDTKDAHDSFNPARALRTSAGAPAVDPALIRELFLARGLSATALNNYFKSPWEYFYKNMLRIPEAQALYLAYGTALHGVMERIAKRRQEGVSLPSSAEASRLLADELGRLPVVAHEYGQLLERGNDALTAYLPHAAKDFPKTVRGEFAVKVALQTGDPTLPEVPLSGKLDRIDLDAHGRAVRVIDYKTGAPKTRGYIEGKTKDSDGGYHRQLVFYALLLKHYEEGRLACRNMTLSFMEPDVRGKIREESYTISDEEIAALEGEIIRVAEEITTGAFLRVPCDPKQTDHCALAARFLNESSQSC